MAISTYVYSYVSTYVCIFHGYLLGVSHVQLCFTGFLFLYVSVHQSLSVGKFVFEYSDEVTLPWIFDIIGSAPSRILNPVAILIQCECRLPCILQVIEVPSLGLAPMVIAC